MQNSCFMLMFGNYAHAIFNFRHTLDNSYSHQHRDGFIFREITENDDSEKFTTPRQRPHLNREDGD